MKAPIYRKPWWWNLVAKAATQKEQLSAWVCVPKGSPFDAIRYQQAEQNYWRIVESVHP